MVAWVEYSILLLIHKIVDSKKGGYRKPMIGLTLLKIYFDSVIKIGGSREQTVHCILWLCACKLFPLWHSNNNCIAYELLQVEAVTKKTASRYIFIFFKELLCFPAKKKKK